MVTASSSPRRCVPQQEGVLIQQWYMIQHAASMPPSELLLASGGNDFSADQLLPGQSEQEGIHACPRTMMASTSPAGGVFGILPAYLAELVKGHLRAGTKWHLTTPRRYRWDPWAGVSRPGQSRLVPGRADSDHGILRTYGPRRVDPVLAEADYHASCAASQRSPWEPVDAYRSGTGQYGP